MQRSPSSQSAAALYESLTERTLVRIAETLRAALHELLALRRQRLERRRGRVPDALANMNVRMLKDIGAPHWLIDRAEAECRQRQSVARSLSWPPIA